MRKLLRRIGYWISHRRHEEALTEELEFHRSMKQEDLERKGIPAADAAADSRRALGNTLSAIESSREVWIWSWLDQFVRDARVGARSLLKAPGFTLFSTLILSIGIGAMITVFALLNSVFFKDLHVPDAASFVRIYDTEDGYRPTGQVRYSVYKEYRDHNQSLAEIGMIFRDRNGAAFPLRPRGPRTLPIDVVPSAIVDHSLFKALGVDMALGRGFDAQDEKTDAPNVVIFNEAAWRRYFAQERNIINKVVWLDNTPYTIVGVLPKSFEAALSAFPTAAPPEMFLPLRGDLAPRSLIDVAGRLGRGVSRTQAQTDFSQIATQFSAPQQARLTPSVERADLPPSSMLQGYAVTVSIFLVIVFSVFLIGCDDIAIMLFARISERQREMGVRVALGGSRAQLIRQLLAENILLSILGGTGAMIFILLTARLVERLPIPLPDTSSMVFEWRSLLFTALISLATTLFFGLRPALECVSRDILASLSPGSKAPSRRQGRVRSNLVVGQIAVCTALLITVATIGRNVQGQSLPDPGFKTDHLWLTDINFEGTAYNRDSQAAFFGRLVQQLNGAPGIDSASIIPGLRSLADLRSIIGNAGVPYAPTWPIDESYFRTFRVSVMAGRAFNERDDLDTKPVGIMNQKLARSLFRDVNPIGRTIRAINGTPIEIVGIVPNLADRSSQPDQPTLYRPLKQVQQAVSNAATVWVRFSGTQGAASQIIHEKASELDSSLFVSNGRTLEDQRAQIFLPARIIGYAFGIPGVFALLLGIVGTYGTMATLVVQRRREIGIRIALGARPSNAVRGILREAIQPVLLGVVAGIGTVVVILLWLRHNIPETTWFDPVAFVTMVSLVTTIAGIACFIPAKRASLFEPMMVLRED